MNSKINILLLNWNSSSDIDSSIQNILNSDYKNFRIILIDNFSKEDDIKNLKDIYEKYKNLCEIHLLLNNENYGYAGGNNRGYDYLVDNNFKGDILVLNPDVMISPNTLFELQNSLSENIGGVMCRTLKSDNSIMYDYIKLNGYFQKWLVSDKNLVETDYLAGSCMLLKREIIDKIGLFDESFFMYWEEVDLSLRIKENGYKLISIINTNVIRDDNLIERSANAVFYNIRNSFLLYKKNKSFKLQSLFIYLFYSFLSAIKQTIVTRKIIFLKKYIFGFLDGKKTFFN